MAWESPYHKRASKLISFGVFSLCFQVHLTGIYSLMTFFYLFSFSLQSSIIMSIVQLALLGGTSLLKQPLYAILFFSGFFSLARTSQCCHLRVTAAPQVVG